MFENCGNYKSFGDTKFVPEVPAEDLSSVLKKAECYKSHKDIVDSIWERIEKEIYTEEDPFRIIGFRDNNGTTSYYSANITSEEAKKVDEFCQSIKLSPLNTRLFKISDTEYDLKIASQVASEEKTPYLKTY